jgi:hypothetical protein
MTTVLHPPIAGVERRAAHLLSLNFGCSLLPVSVWFAVGRRWLLEAWIPGDVWLLSPCTSAGQVQPNGGLRLPQWHGHSNPSLLGRLPRALHLTQPPPHLP